MTDASQPAARPVDFRRPSKFSHEHIRQLERTHANFVQSASSRLSAELRMECELSLAEMEQLPYSEVMLERAPREALVVILQVEPLEHEIALIMEIPLTLFVLNRVLGAAEESPIEVAGTTLTDLEVTIARHAVESLIDTLSNTWNDTVDTELTLASMENSPVTVQIVPPSEPCLLVKIDITIKEMRSQLLLCIPHRSVEPILHRFSQEHYKAAAPTSETVATMRHNLGKVDVELRAEVGAVDVPLSQLLSLKEGDVIRLRRPKEEGAILYIEDQPAWKTSQGTRNNARAVQIEEELR